MPLTLHLKLVHMGNFIFCIFYRTQKTMATSVPVLGTLSLERAASKAQPQGTAAPNPLTPVGTGSVSY